LARMAADVCRTAAYSELCYHRMLDRVQWWNQALEIFVAVATAGAVGSWAIWQEGTGKVVWQVLGGMVTLLNIVKPYFKLGDKINVGSRQASAYRELFVDSRALCDSLHIEGKIDDALATSIRQLRSRLDPLERADIIVPHRIKQACQKQINEQFPKEYFWHPTAGGSDGSKEEKSTNEGQDAGTTEDGGNKKGNANQSKTATETEESHKKEDASG
jgi:hypothetical protein